MKSALVKLIAIALLAGTMLSAVACAKPNEAEDPKQTTASTVGSNETVEGTVESEVITEYVPDIEKKDYDSDLNIVIGGTIPADHIVMTEEDSSGDLLDTTIYERGVKIEEHLGVTCVIQDAGSWTEYSGNVIRTVQAGDDDYQLIYTPVYQGVCDLVTSNVLYDFQDFDAVNLDAPYWNSNLMEEIAIQDDYFLGYNDTCLSLVKLIVFNKDMLESYRLESPYDLVRSKTWTLPKLMEMSSGIYVDSSGDGRDYKDTYGITGWGWVPLISLITSSGLKIVDRNAEGDYEIAYEHDKEKMINLIDMVFKLYNAEYSWFWKSTPDPDTQVSFSDGTCLFQFFSSDGLVGFRDKDIRFGVLPYPLWDEKQEDYKTLNWNGLMAVPNTIRNPDMVGEVLEMMAYYTAPVKNAYYEELLSAKLADAPDDVEMLNILWDTQVSDIGIVTCNASQNMDSMVYMLPLMLEKGQNTFASYMKGQAVRAQTALDKVFKQGKYAE